MISPFLLQNAHFVVEVLIALCSLIVGWLFVDAWSVKREKKTIVRAAGLLLFSLTSLIGVTQGFGAAWTDWAYESLFIVSLIVITSSFLLEPLPNLPSETRTHKTWFAWLPLVGLIGLVWMSELIGMLLLVWCAVLIYRRAGRGLIREWRPMGHAFVVWAFAQLATVSYLWRGTDNVVLNTWVGEEGILWFVEHGLRLLAFVLLAKWAWGYIRFRIVPQMFVVSVSGVFVIFIATTVLFSSLLIRTVQKDELAQMEVSVRTVGYALDQLQERAALLVKYASVSDGLLLGLEEENEAALTTVSGRLLQESGADVLSVVNPGGEIVVAAHDESLNGELRTEHELVQSVFEDRVSAESFLLQPGLVSPTVTIEAVHPMISEAGKTVGATLGGFALDTAFVDRLKTVTGLDVTVFAEDQRSATTLMTGDSRELGIVETDPVVLRDVLENGETLAQEVDILNVPYYAAYLPLTNVSGSVVGMVQVARPQLAVLEATRDTLNQTFLAAIILMALSTIPTYGLAKYIARYQKS